MTARRRVGVALKSSGFSDETSLSSSTRKLGEVPVWAGAVVGFGAAAAAVVGAAAGAVVGAAGALVGLAAGAEVAAGAGGAVDAWVAVGAADGEHAATRVAALARPSSRKQVRRVTVPG